MNTEDTASPATKWWGWGDASISFTHDDKPGFGAFMRRALNVDVKRVTSQPVSFETLSISDPALDRGLLSDLTAAVGSTHVSTGASIGSAPTVWWYCGKSRCPQPRSSLSRRWNRPSTARTSPGA